ncbi:MAG: CopG family transcriptional regulator [Xenococcus sp. MO_188.B8]|nr:CopG family transcriptional regulator [Xenococcus sp. MO_188.B8]
MSERITITLDKEAYEFLELNANGNPSAFITKILKAEKQRIIAEKILQDNQEEAEESYQQQLANWI